jgi:lycopene beta-cyclase
MSENAQVKASHFDYIIAGGGCAGRSLALELVHQPKLSGKKILIIDKDSKKENDRTWSFWEKEPGSYESIVHKSWPEAWVSHGNIAKKCRLHPYTYKTIRGVDFYQFTEEQLRKFPQVEFLQSPIHQMDEEGHLTCDTGVFTADYIFSSLPETSLKNTPHIWLWQHFLGYVIETEEDIFDDQSLTFMDFRVPQPEGACFIYILPYSKRKALIEYTLFSPNKWSRNQYLPYLEDYLQKNIKAPYRIVEEELGAIPMTNYPFERQSGKIIRIGTAGGASKPSTGFTFSRIQRDVKAIASNLAHGKSPLATTGYGKGRFMWYDSALLDMLKKNEYSGPKFFFDLFMKNPAHRILSFLDDSTCFHEELKVMSSTPIVMMACHSIKNIRHLF